MPFFTQCLSKRLQFMSTIIGLYGIPDLSNDEYPFLVHDHNITVFENGNIKNYLHLERFTRKKFDAGMPGMITDISRTLGLIPANESIFIFVDHEIGRAFLSDDKQVRFEAPFSEKLSVAPEKARLYWYGNYPEAYIINHELAHIYSCVPFFGDFKENSLAIHFDGGASRSNFSAWTHKEGKLKLLEANYDYKWLSGLFNANALVFAMVNTKKKEQNSVPGKFMGLEAYGNYNREIEKWLIENDFFSSIWSSKSTFFKQAGKKFGVTLKHIDNKSPFIQDIAATIHEIFIREMMKVFTKLAKKSCADYLYYSGGSALNIKLNAAILRSGLFKEVFIPPCTNDSGLSLGAIAALCDMKGIPIKTVTPYLNNFAKKMPEVSDINFSSINKIGDLIAENAVLGICNGDGEVGPRALGNRSIIARADSKQLVRKISIECKQREWYRPVAPIMLEKNAKYFTGHMHFEPISELMITEYKILPEKIQELEGCVHIDGTSRIQVLRSAEQNKFMFELLSYLDEKHKIKALINTSFNRKGEPIVQTTDQAFEAATAMKLDGVVLNGELKEFLFEGKDYKA